MIVSISTGSIRHAASSVLESVHFVEENFSGLVNGVELFFWNMGDFESFELDDRATEFLQSLEFNTLHAPIKEIEYGENQATARVLEKIERMGKAVNIERVVFHPNHVKDFTIVANTGLRACVENLPDGELKKGWQYPKEFQEFFKKWPQLGFCFDVNHGIANGIKPTEFISLLSKKIEYIHLNATAKAGSAEHELLVESSEKTIEEIMPVFKLQKPMVIEVDIEKQKIPLIKKEIEFIRQATL
ncbi:MAG: TIM barrel protein [Candidatus Diapherotrites archaeon]|nr:TIM barrel protein [Candidatus Diapherotrites archaeon]